MSVLRKTMLAVMFGLLVSCGQDPAFDENLSTLQEGDGSGETGEGVISGTNPGEEGLDGIADGSDGTDKLDGEGSGGYFDEDGNYVPPVVVDTSSPNPSFNPDIVEVPGADDEDLDTLKDVLQTIEMYHLIKPLQTIEKFMLQ